MDKFSNQNIPSFRSKNATSKQYNDQKNSSKWKDDDPSKGKPRTVLGMTFRLIIVLFKKIIDFLEGLPNFHIYSLFLSILFHGFFWFVILNREEIGILFVAALTVILYFYLVAEAFKDPVYKQLQEIHTNESAADYMRRIREKAPNIGWGCRCFHHESRPYWQTVYHTEYKSQYDPHQNGYVSVPVSRSEQVQRVGSIEEETYRTHQNFIYQNWEDVSDNLTNKVLRSSVVRLECDVKWSYANPVAEKRYRSQQNDFLKIHKNYDDQFSWWSWFNVDGYQKYLVVLSYPEAKPWFLGEDQYLLASLLGFSWFYRMWLECVSASARVCFKKQVF